MGVSSIAFHKVSDARHKTVRTSRLIRICYKIWACAVEIQIDTANATSYHTRTRLCSSAMGYMTFLVSLSLCHLS